MRDVDGTGKGTVFLVDHGMRDLKLIDKVFGKSIAENLRFLRVVYGITIAALDEDPEDPKNIKAWGLYQGDIWASLRVFRQEVIKYPSEYIRTYINKARLVEGLTKPHPSDPSRRLSVGGLACFKGPTYIVQNFRNEPYTRGVVHHEFMHCPDLAEGWDGEEGELARWLSYNPRKDMYFGDVYWDMPRRQRVRYRTKAFASLYGRKDVLEDRGTIAEDLFTNPKKLYERAGADTGLRKKIEHLKGDFRRRSCDRMGDQYFEDLAAGKVGEGYWEVNKSRKFYASCWAKFDYYSGAYRKQFKEWVDSPATDK